MPNRTLQRLITRLACCHLLETIIDWPSVFGITRLDIEDRILKMRCA
jgi:hypothetical protein